MISLHDVVLQLVDSGMCKFLAANDGVLHKISNINNDTNCKLRCSVNPVGYHGKGAITKDKVDNVVTTIVL